MGWFQNLLQKLNPAQPDIYREEGSSVNSINTSKLSFAQAYERIEAVNRGVNIIVEGFSLFEFDIADTIDGITPVVPGIRKKKLHRLLNFEPNKYQDIASFRGNMCMDYLIEGNIFLYWDGAFLYHLPAANVEIITDPKTFVNHYKYGEQKFSPEEIVHIKENSTRTIYRGTSRLSSAANSISTLDSMIKFQSNFFDNSAVPGLVLTTPNVLSEKIKERLVASWAIKYNPKNGGKRPLILDGGLDVKPISATNFEQLDFEASVSTHERKILKALGVPPILLDGGNNANIAPNLRLLYLETILPIVRKVSTALERYFGYDIKPITAPVSALQPDLKETASYFATLVNGGIITPNEAREELRFEPKEGQDEIRVPANIAGSAANPSEGGKPKGNSDAK